MDLQALFHWLYIIGMAIGAIHFILLGKNRAAFHDTNI